MNRPNRSRRAGANRRQPAHNFDKELRYRKQNTATAVVGEELAPMYEEYFPSAEFKDKSLTKQMLMRSFPQQVARETHSVKVLVENGEKVVRLTDDGLIEGKTVEIIRRARNGNFDVVKSDKTLLITSKAPSRIVTDELITTKNRPYGAKRRFYRVEEIVETKPVETQIEPPKEQRSDLTVQPDKFTNPIHFSPAKRKGK